MPTHGGSPGSDDCTCARATVPATRAPEGGPIVNGHPFGGLTPGGAVHSEELEDPAGPDRGRAPHRLCRGAAGGLQPLRWLSGTGGRQRLAREAAAGVPGGDALAAHERGERRPMSPWRLGTSDSRRTGGGRPTPAPKNVDDLEAEFDRRSRRWSSATPTGGLGARRATSAWNSRKAEEHPGSRYGWLDAVRRL